jgi:hypothetical protein
LLACCSLSAFPIYGSCRRAGWSPAGWRRARSSAFREASEPERLPQRAKRLPHMGVASS